MNITIISGSPRTESKTARIAQLLTTELRKKSSTIAVTDIYLHKANLPHIQSVWQDKKDAPLEFQNIFETMEKSDAFIFVSPEYNGGFSPALKNFVDHFPKNSYYRKPMAIAVGSPGAFGGMRAAMHLQQYVAALFGILLPQMLIIPQLDKKITETGTTEDAATIASVGKCIDEYLWLVTKLR
ncbi:MAG: NAD(P)H-dependent oxidoreductase [Bacteroidetes bacterium]|nr:NAD(P)H-dependent oxidoreductase [Bacteroidota bacterium]